MNRLGFIHIALEILDRGSQKVETQFIDGDSLYKVTIERAEKPGKENNEDHRIVRRGGS